VSHGKPILVVLEQDNRGGGAPVSGVDVAISTQFAVDFLEGVDEYTSLPSNLLPLRSGGDVSS